LGALFSRLPGPFATPTRPTYADDDHDVNGDGGGDTDVIGPGVEAIGRLGVQTPMIYFDSY